jgi:threonine/homoserine/homoserine lactone efflux protein
MTLDFLPDPSVMAAYTLACLVLFITPGPDMSLFLAKTLSGGRRHGIAAMAGTSVGCVGHTLLAAIGLSALLNASVTAFTVLKIIGALYLAWMAYDAIRHGSALNVATEADPAAEQRGVVRSFWMGVGVNLSNPKVVLFFVTFLPQFVSAADPHAEAKLAFLGLYFVAVSVPLAVMMILLAERVVGYLKARPKALRAIDYVFAGIFSAFAVKILMTQAGR